MATCVTEQSSSIMSNIDYPRKLLRAATYDSLMPVMTSRKRLLSEQSECYNFMRKVSNDDINANKRTKTGNYIT
jgi:hypothetical protein